MAPKLGRGVSEASVLHDQLVMLQLGTHHWRAWLMNWGVRADGWGAWHRHRKGQPVLWMSSLKNC